MAERLTNFVASEEYTTDTDLNDEQRPLLTQIDGVKVQVDELVDILHDNVEKLADRGGRLSLLERKSDSLAQKAHRFKKLSRRVRIKMWCQEKKSCVVLTSLVSFLLICGAIVFVLYEEHVI